jgi:predicted oxidoreductase
MSTRREFLTRTTAVGLLAGACGERAQGLARPILPGPTTPMKTYRIPRTDLVVSRLAFGCALVGIDPKSADFAALVTPMIQAAYSQGITFFDLADVYGAGQAEKAMGEVLKQSPGLRARVVIQSKCGYTDSGTVDNTHDYIVRSAEGSLKRLNTDHLDILLLHSSDLLVEPEDVAKAFDELHRSGKVRYFGVSNHSPDQIELLRTHVRQPIVVNQILLGLLSWSIVEDGHPPGERGATVNYCRGHDIQVQAHSPLRASYATRPSVLDPAADAPPSVKEAAALLVEVAKRHDVTPTAVMLAWLLRHPAGIVPVLGGTKPEHLISNCAADRVELSREEWYSLLEAGAESVSS